MVLTALGVIVALSAAPATWGQTLTPTQVKRLSDAAAGGDVAAMKALGSAYLHGELVKANIPEAVRLLDAAAAKGEANAAMELAIHYQDEPAPYRKYLRLASDAGMVLATEKLAQTYNGRGGQEVDYRQGARLLREAADKGSAMAAYGLGLMHVLGRGVSADAVEGDRWMRIAAALDLPEAKTWLMTPRHHYAEASQAEHAAAVALADRVLAESKAGTVLENATVAGVAMVSHPQSGLICTIPRGENYRVAVAKDGSVVCTRPGVELEARPALAGMTEKGALAAWTEEMIRLHPELKPLASPPVESPGTRFSEAWLSDGAGAMRLNLGIIDGWVFRERIFADTGLWSKSTTGWRVLSDLNHAAPLPRERPAIKVIDRPRPASATDDGAAPTPDMIRAHVAACTPSGAFGEKFGSTEPSGRPQPRISNSIRVTPAVDAPGVGTLELVVTDKSGRIHSITSISPRYPDKAELRTALAAGREEARRLGWTEADADDGALNYVFVRRGADGKPELELEVGDLLGSASTTCRDPRLMALSLSELTGRIRPAERPEPPAVPPPAPRVWAVDCHDPGVQRVILATAFDQSRSRFGLGSSWDRYWDALASWKIGLIADKAKLTRAQTDELTLKSTLGGMENGFAENVANLTGGIKELGAMDDALKAGDFLGACRNAVAWLDATDDIVTGNRGQWRAMHAYIDAEARRRGVTFD